MKTVIFIASAIIFSCGCQKKQEVGKDYNLILDDGIYVEEFGSTNISENRYTENNTCYVEGNRLTYDYYYYYQDLENNEYKFEEMEGVRHPDFGDTKKAWFLVPIDSLTEKTIDKVVLTVTYGLEPMIRNNPDYNQTVIRYDYPQVNGKQYFNSSTGVIENEKNVWIHPPRDKLFRILELNPFPFIQSPYEIGNKWEWSLEIGSYWGDERWKEWEGSIRNEYEYEIVNKSTIDTGAGAFECYVIKGTAISRIGKTQLTAYFNKDVGFVKLDYTNIDSTKLILELIEIEKKEQ